MHTLEGQKSAVRFTGGEKESGNVGIHAREAARTRCGAEPIYPLEQLGPLV